jgi:Zn-dependent protease
VALGRIAGIPVAAHWSVLGIVALIAVVVARSEMPTLAPGHGPIAYGAAGLTVALLLMISLLAHEVAHALVSRAQGLEVESITLWLLGGTTRLRGDPDRPGPEFRIAVVGPLTSGALAGLFALGAGLTAGGLVDAVLVELALVNLVLAVFNLLPAAPLDGGRVLAALLWAARGDRWGAGIAAARVGLGLGALLLGLGVATGLLVDLSGLWLALVGWFVAAAAADEERRARLGRALDGLPVAAAATPPPVLLAADASPGEITAAIVSPAGRAAGVLLTGDEGDLVGYLPPEPAPSPRSGDPHVLRRRTVPPSRLTRVGPDDRLAPLLGRLAEPGSRLVVLTGGTPVGLVSAAEVVQLAGGSDRVARPVDGMPRPGTPGAARPAPDDDAPPPPGWWWHGGPLPGRAPDPAATPPGRPTTPSV